MPKLYLHSLGCNKNLVDSEIMLGRLENYALTAEPAAADVLIVNTCGFIKSAKEESIASILQLHQVRKKGSLLVVTGCLMQRYKDELVRALPEVDLFTGAGDFERIDELILRRLNAFSNSIYTAENRGENAENSAKFVNFANLGGENSKNSANSVNFQTQNANFKEKSVNFSPLAQENSQNFAYLQGENTKRIITGSNSHAFVKIAEGCNQSCSFCAIPNFKGKLRSRSVASIVSEVQSLVAQGFFDFSFIAQDSSSFLLDSGQKDGLIALIDAIEGVRGVQAARILYLYPTSVSLQLIERIKKSRVFVNYFDMPLQHINDKMLNLMRRGASKARLQELLSAMSACEDAFLRTGFIVGHPWESEAEFNELCEFIEASNFDRISIFGYSKEEDTRAFKMPQTPTKTINSRLKIIEKIVDKKIEQSFAREIGKRRKVVCTGTSSEGEFFIAGKDLRWDRDIDGEILINESLCGALEQGKVYECEILQSVDKKLVARALRACDE